MDNKGCGCRGGQTDIGKAEEKGRTVTEGTAVYINSLSMGRGDDQLGEKLMGVYLDTLSNFARDITHLILVNSGVKLACRGSDSLEQLKNLEGTGIKILSCGTCINHFNLKEELAAGKISNMVEIQEVLLNSKKILTP